MALSLQVLDPQTDIELFRESYFWRPEPKKHVGANRATFEDFISDDPRQIVIGVFNGEFIAAFLLYETEPKVYDCHFTSKRGTGRNLLLEGGMLVRNALFGNGAMKLTAKITERNRPLRQYLEDLGFVREENTCQSQSDCVNLSHQRPFVEYGCVGEPPSDLDSS